jgi:hypothetical protein
MLEAVALLVQHQAEVEVVQRLPVLRHRRHYLILGRLFSTQAIPDSQAEPTRQATQSHKAQGLRFMVALVEVGALMLAPQAAVEALAY